MTDTAMAPDAPAVESESLADHAAAFAPGADAAASRARDRDDGDDGEAGGRDDQGRFVNRPRHRAASQRATPDDVGAINALTRTIREHEDALGADIARKDGESDRVYSLRRRAELLERQRAPTPASLTPPAAAPPSPPVPAASATRVAPNEGASGHPPSAEPPRPFMGYEAYLESNPEATWDDYDEARQSHRYKEMRRVERAEEAQQAAARTQQERMQRHVEAFPAARAKYADFDAVAFNTAAPVSAVMLDAMLQSAQSTEIRYFLGKYPAISAELAQDSAAIGPEGASVMRRHLEALVASATSSSSSPAQAAPTGSAAVVPVTPLPKPPNPVRTTGIAAAEPPGDDDMSVSAHEKHFAPRRRS